MSSLPLRANESHYRHQPAASLRPALPVANETLWERCAAVLPGTKGMEPREAARFAKARRYSVVADILALRIGMRHQPAVLGRFEDEVRSAVSEPLDSTKPLTEVLLLASIEDAEGDTALVQLVADDSEENLRAFVRAIDEKLGALSLARSAALQTLAMRERAQ